MRTQVIVGVGVVGLMGGIMSRSFFIPDTWRVVGLCVALAAVLYGMRRFGLGTVTISLAIAFSAYTLGAWRFASVERAYDARVAAYAALEHETTLMGVVVRDPEERDMNTVLVVALEDGTKVRVSTAARHTFEYGDAVTIEGALERPQSFQTDLGRTFPYEGYLRAQGITHTMSSAQVVRVSSGGGSVILSALYAGKRAFATSIEHMLPEPHAGFALGLLLGEKHGLGETLTRIFREVGIVHIIVLSGYNLTIIADALMRLLARVVLPKTRVLIGATAIILFAAMVGPSATVLRATLMALLVLFARATGRSYAALRALLVAGAAMVLANPYALPFDPGFQFSYLATLGLILLGPRFDELFVHVPSWGGVREYLTSTVATQIMVTPLLLWSIGSVSLVAVLANVLILAAVPLSMLLSFVAGCVGLFTPSFIILGYPAYLLLSYILTMAEVLSRVPFASVTTQPFPFAIVVCAYGVIALCIAYSKRKAPDAIAAGALRVRA